MSEWQPIESAPKDGRGILICKVPCDHWSGMFVAHWDEWGEWAFASDRFVRNPTHWMPLPPSPATP